MKWKKMMKECEEILKWKNEIKGWDERGNKRKGRGRQRNRQKAEKRW